MHWLQLWPVQTNARRLRAALVPLLEVQLHRWFDLVVSSVQFKSRNCFDLVVVVPDRASYVRTDREMPNPPYDLLTPRSHRNSRGKKKSWFVHRLMISWQSDSNLNRRILDNRPKRESSRTCSFRVCRRVTQIWRRLQWDVNGLKRTYRFARI